MISDLLSAHKKSFAGYTELRAQINNVKQVTFLSVTSAAKKNNHHRNTPINKDPTGIIFLYFYK